MGGPELEDYLILLAKVKCLQVPPAAQIPHVHVVPVAAGQEDLRVEARLDHVGSAPELVTMVS